MRSEAVGALACPVCGSSLSEIPGALRCEHGHGFDIARQGYVNLLTSPAPSAGDTAEMVAARHAFLGRGHFAPIAEAVASVARGCAMQSDAVRPGRPNDSAACVLAEVGAGTAYYLTAAVESTPGSVGIALDVSRYAARRAARAHAGIVAVVANAWDRLPLRDKSVDVLLDVFAPRNAAEFARVLRPTGTLVVVTPNAGHLAELVRPLGLIDVDPDKDRRLAVSLESRFVRVSEQEVCASLTLSREDVAAAAGMGPSAHHVPVATLEQCLAGIREPVLATLDVTVSVWAQLD